MILSKSIRKSLFRTFFWKSKNFQLFEARQAPDLTFPILKFYKNAKGAMIWSRNFSWNYLAFDQDV